MAPDQEAGLFEANIKRIVWQQVISKERKEGHFLCAISVSGPAKTLQPVKKNLAARKKLGKL
jgi:hypothetical protein